MRLLLRSRELLPVAVTGNLVRGTSDASVLDLDLAIEHESSVRVGTLPTSSTMKSLSPPM